MFVVEGPTLVHEAVTAGWTIVECFVTPESDFDLNCDVHELSESLFTAVADVKSPQGVMAVVSMNPPWRSSPGSIVGRGNDADAQNGIDTEWVLVADAISDPGNLGTIMRSAEAAGASAIFLVGDCVDPYSPKTVRSSAGALFHVPVESATYDEVKKQSFRLLGLTSHDRVANSQSVSMYEVSLNGRIAVVVGSEAHGISPHAPIDTWVTIPHRGRAESLNAAMAATVMCMHVDRVRHVNVPRSTGHLH